MELLILQKALVQLVQPVGLIWVVLLLIAMRAWYKREVGTSRLLACLWLSYSLAGNSIVSDALVGTLENRFDRIRPLQMQPLDTIVVLGGGTKSTADGDPALADSGDRVCLAARLYHAGKAHRILVSGKQIESISTGPSGDPAVQATQLLIQLGVPPSRISALEGRNTFEEMLALKEVLVGGGEGEEEGGQAQEEERGQEEKGGQAPLPEGPTGAAHKGASPLFSSSGAAHKRASLPFSSSDSVGPSFSQVGLITSAWHLPRALRLAAKAGLKLQPIPADFASSPVHRTILDLIPDHGAFRNTARTIKEYLGMALGR